MVDKWIINTIKGKEVHSGWMNDKKKEGKEESPLDERHGWMDGWIIQKIRKDKSALVAWHQWMDD